MTYSTLAAAASGEVKEQGSGAPRMNPKTDEGMLDDWCNAPGISSPSVSQHKLHDRERSCLISLSAMDRLRTKKDFSLVDVRSPSEYDRYRIADSINIPLHQVKTKAFLKKLSVVLVNDGRSTIVLEKTCGELKQAGFDRIAVLDGGLFGWYTSNRPLEGDPSAQSKLNRTTAGELFEERAMSDWSVIDVSTPGKYKDMRPWLPGNIIAIPLESKGKSKGDPIAQISSSISQQRKKNPQTKLLLIADDDRDYQRIDARLKKSGIATSVLRLNGGFNAYREHVAKQLAVWREQSEPKRYAACRG